MSEKNRTDKPTTVNMPTRVPEALYESVKKRLNEMGGRRTGRTFQKLVESLLESWLQDERYGHTGDSPGNIPDSFDSQLSRFSTRITEEIRVAVDLARQVHNRLQEVENQLATELLKRADQDVAAALEKHGGTSKAGETKHGTTPGGGRKAG